MAHAQKPDFVFRRIGRVHLNRRGRQFSRLLAVEACASAFIVGSNAGYTILQGSVKGTGYTLHSPVSPSLPLPYVTVCHHISTGVYLRSRWKKNVSVLKLGRNVRLYPEPLLDKVRVVRLCPEPLIGKDCWVDLLVCGVRTQPDSSTQLEYRNISFHRERK